MLAVERQVNKPMVRIEEVKAEDTYSIRKSMLRKGMTLSHKMNGDQEMDTLHLGLFDSNELVCIGSFMKTSNNEFIGLQYQLRGMATIDAYQGRGFGKMLLDRGEQILKNKHVNLIWCNARLVAINFYKKLGYQTNGNVFEVKEVGPHYVMFKELK